MEITKHYYDGICCQIEVKDEGVENPEFENKKIMYVCDREACENCHKECHYTSDINHAEYFFEDEEGSIFEMYFEDMVEKHSKKIDNVLNNITKLIFLLTGLFSGATIAAVILELINH